jgi:hypothetical protein
VEKQQRTTYCANMELENALAEEWFDTILSSDGYNEMTAYCLSTNKHLTMKTILKHPKQNWNWKYLSEHPNITMDIILQNPQLNWSYFGILRNPNVTPEMFEICQNKLICFPMTIKATRSIWSRPPISSYLTKLLLFSIHEYYTANPHDVSTFIEHILFDDYLLSRIAKY